MAVDSMTDSADGPVVERGLVKNADGVLALPFGLGPEFVENAPVLAEDKQLHLVVDNYATHKHPAVQRWLKRHPRFHFHFTPTSASWLNMVERFFRDLTVNRLRRGVFRDVMELVRAIDAYVDQHNEHPKPFIWTASANDILEKVKRARKIGFRARMRTAKGRQMINRKRRAGRRVQVV